MATFGHELLPVESGERQNCEQEAAQLWPVTWILLAQTIQLVAASTGMCSRLAWEEAGQHDWGRKCSKGLGK